MNSVVKLTVSACFAPLSHEFLDVCAAIAVAAVVLCTGSFFFSFHGKKPRTTLENPVRSQCSKIVRYTRALVMYRRFYSRALRTNVSDSEFDDLETPPRYRPESVQYFCRTTGFTESEIKKIYRNFKTECPTGLIREDAFRGIYSQFFPQGGTLSQTSLTAVERQGEGTVFEKGLLKDFMYTSVVLFLKRFMFKMQILILNIFNL